MLESKHGFVQRTNRASPCNTLKWMNEDGSMLNMDSLLETIIWYAIHSIFYSSLATSVALNSISGLLCRSTTCGVMSREWKGACTTKLYSIPNIQQYNTKRSSNYFKLFQICSNITSSGRLSHMDGRSYQKAFMASAYQSEYS